MNVMQDISRPVMNYNKSNLFFSKGAGNKHIVAEIIKVDIDNLPIMCLGIPLSHNKLKARNFRPLMTKLTRNRIARV